MGIKLKIIFENEWEDFKNNSDSDELKRLAVHDNVEKMLKCKTLWMGLQVYQCEDHPDQARLVPCTCKSRFCPSCGYKANLIWLNQLLERTLPCDHQHLVFSLPCELRNVARANRRAIFNLMSKCLWQAIKRWIKNHKKLGYEPGAVAILHTFGKGLKWHIHYHVLITAGGLRKDEWFDNPYINEEALKKSFKAKMLKGLRKLYHSGKLVYAKGRFPGESFLQMLPHIYDKNWYVWLDAVRGDSAFAFIYIGRYCKRACISQKGFIKYQKGKIIAWKERSKIETPNICAHQETPENFIELLIAHIPDRYDHQVHYFGLYSSREKNTKYGKALENLNRSRSRKKEPKDLKLNYLKLMNWTHGKNPLACPICEKDMRMTGILFFNPRNPEEKELLDNFEVKNYELVEKKFDTS